MHKKSYEKGRMDAAESMAVINREMYQSQKKFMEEEEKLLEEWSKDAGIFQKNKFKKHLEDFKKNKIPWTFDIKIVYEKELGYAEDIRKCLNNGTEKGSTAYCVRYEAYKTKPTNSADYTIFVGDFTAEMPKKYQIIHEKYGCFMAVKDNQIFLNCDVRKIDNHEKFLQYYEELVTKEMEFAYQQERIEKLFKDKKKYEKDEGGFFSKARSVLKDVEKKMYGKSKFLALYLKTAGMLYAGPVIAVIPIGISEEMGRKLLREIKKGRIDKEILSIAQRQILQVILCEYIREEQIKYAI